MDRKLINEPTNTYSTVKGSRLVTVPLFRMGGSISAGADNDEMIDNLIKSRYIRTDVVEKVFRSVDRAFYFLTEFQHTAYRDLAWKQGNLHLSAPCIYSEVLEHLKLEPSHSFLNIGSGTGYLSTLAGLILGPYGTNHGIEVHADVVEYAYEKLELFKKTCNGIDVFEFCEPIFVVGNAFNLNQDRRYDRIYCGAACPVFHQEHIKKFMKVGGILVLPCEDDLLKITRTSEETWEISSVLPVSFSTLQFPDKNISSMVSMPEPEPLRLQEICRSTIRSLLRSLVETEEPELTQKRKCKQRSSLRKLCHEENCVVIPVFEDATGVENAFAVQSSRFENFRPIAFERLIRNLARNYQNLDDNTYESVSNTPLDSANEHLNMAAHLDTRENNTLSSAKMMDTQPRVRDTVATGRDVAMHRTSIIDSEMMELMPNVENNTSIPCSEIINDDSNNSHLNSDEHNRFCGNNTCNIDHNHTYKSNIDRSNEYTDNLFDSGSSCSRSISSCDNRNINQSRNDANNSKGANRASIGFIRGSDERHVVVKDYKSSHDAEKRTNMCMTDLNNVMSDVTNENTGVTTSSSRPRHIAIKLRKGRFATKIKTTKKHCSLVRNNLHHNAWKEASDEAEGSTSDLLPKKAIKREKLDSGISEESDDGKFSASNASSFAESTNFDEMEIDSDRDSDFIEDSSYEENGSDMEPTVDGNSSNSISLKYRTCMERKIHSLPLPKALKFYLNYNRDFLSSS